MLWIISAAAVAGIAAAGVFAALWWRVVRWGNHQMETILEKNRALNDAYNDCDHWKHEACVHLERERAAVEQAKVFERVSKTMEEHAAAECGRADRLAAALRESEDEVERLRAELDKVRRAEPAHHTGTVEHLAQEFANIMAYNGSEQGQVDLNNE